MTNYISKWKTGGSIILCAMSRHIHPFSCSIFHHFRFMFESINNTYPSYVMISISCLSVLLYSGLNVWVFNRTRCQDCHYGGVTHDYALSPHSVCSTFLIYLVYLDPQLCRTLCDTWHTQYCMCWILTWNWWTNFRTRVACEETTCLCLRPYSI